MESLGAAQQGVEREGSSDIVAWSQAYLESYHSAQIKPPPAESVNLLKVWKPPDMGGIKVNVDVAIPDGSAYHHG